MSRTFSLKTLLTASLAGLFALFMFGCAKKVPDDVVLYVADTFSVKQGHAGKWQDFYVLDSGGLRLISALACHAANKAIAVSTVTRSLLPGSAKIVLIDPATHKVLKEINTGLDQIRSMSFDRGGKRLALIVKQFKIEPLKLYVLTLSNESLQFITEGELLDASWGKDDEIFLSYKKGEKKLVGDLRIDEQVVINKIADGISISASDIRDAFVYIDTTGKVITNEKGVAKTLSVPLQFQDIRFTSRVKFVHGSDSIIVAKYAAQWDVLYLLRPPYSHSQVILDRWNFISFEATTN
ncbi:MAG: hypothetical protein M0Z67_19090 [Nitrospiraceae bacterium]|nr:hypothetical protein [Nitrospiraceae bacterium]